jgi:hypothetical protein
MKRSSMARAMRTAGLCLMAGCLTLTSCAPRPEKMIIGTWQGVDSNQPGQIVQYEFNKDGSMRYRVGQGSIQGKYHFLEDHKTIVYELQTGTTGKLPLQGPITVTEEELTLPTGKGNEIKLKRVKT